jgi:multiple sugar transport system permease protein
MAPTPSRTPAPPVKGGRRSRIRLSKGDRIATTFMIVIPCLVHFGLVWIPALSSVALSFTKWDGIGSLSKIKFFGLGNYRYAFDIDPYFWVAVRHNILWLVFLIVLPTVFGLLLAVLLDRNLKFTRIYQSVFYLPVMLSLVVVGFMWQLIYAPEEGLLNNLLGRTAQGNQIDWLGDPRRNIWAVLIAAAWRHAGYVMVLYLAGLKGVDPTLKEAAAIDGASSKQMFWKVVFPTMKPVNIVVLVITVIESLRAFDLVYITNKGRNGLELISVLVTNNIIGEGGTRVGYGSALAVLLLIVSLGFIITYLWNAFRSDT